MDFFLKITAVQKSMFTVLWPIQHIQGVRIAMYDSNARPQRVADCDTKLHNTGLVSGIGPQSPGRLIMCKHNQSSTMK